MCPRKRIQNILVVIPLSHKQVSTTNTIIIEHFYCDIDYNYYYDYEVLFIFMLTMNSIMIFKYYISISISSQGYMIIVYHHCCFCHLFFDFQCIELAFHICIVHVFNIFSYKRDNRSCYIFLICKLRTSLNLDCYYLFM